MDPAPSPPPPPAAFPSGPAHLRSAFLAAVLGWLVPGLGQVYVGRPGKALLMFVAIGGLFAAGLYLTAFTCVDPEAYGLEFVAHAFLGGPTAAAYHLGQDAVLLDPLPHFEVGRLYAAVAGLLNIVAICDALGEVLEHNRQVRAQRDLLERQRARQREALAQTLAAAAQARADARAAAPEEPVDLEAPDPLATPRGAPEAAREPEPNLPYWFDDPDRRRGDAS